jgi:hypothetical protein
LAASLGRRAAHTCAGPSREGASKKARRQSSLLEAPESGVISLVLCSLGQLPL